MLKIVLLALTMALASASLEADWKIFKDTYKKVYSDEEDVLRRFIYQSNMKMIEEHNEFFAKKKSSFYMGENQFADWTKEEINKKMNGLRVTVQPGPVNEEEKVLNIPKNVDWRKKGYVTPVKDQGGCGSCYAFSATGSMEGQHFNATKKLVSLSESNLVDCSTSYGNDGCNGGLMDNCFEYAIANRGIDAEASYSYIPKFRDCHFKRPVGARFSSYSDVERGSEAALQEAIATVGPISIGIDASQSSFHYYKGGVYDEPDCSSSQLDHGVLAVGYSTTKDGKEYYIVKNSWSESWGNEGYIWMSRNKNNQCGIATAASYPIV